MQEKRKEIAVGSVLCKVRKDFSNFQARVAVVTRGLVYEEDGKLCWEPNR
jgi:hypothetical protein